MALIPLISLMALIPDTKIYSCLTSNALASNALKFTIILPTAG